MSDLHIKIPTKEQLMWPAVLVSVVMSGGSGVGLIDRWAVYQKDRAVQEQQRYEDMGRLLAKTAENARQNAQEWKVFSEKYNHLQERVAILEGKNGILYPHTHEPIPSVRP